MGLPVNSPSEVAAYVGTAVIRDEDQLAAFREQRAQQQAQAQQAAQAQQMQTMAAETAMQRSVKAA